MEILMLYCILILNFVFELTCVVPSAPDIKAMWRNQFASILTSFITVRSHRNLICHSALITSIKLNNIIGAVLHQ